MTIIESSVLDYPERGPWGSSKYPGNTTGYLVRDLIETYDALTVLDPMEGSGTSRDVCKQFGPAYLGYDIVQGHDILQTQTRKLITREVAREFGDHGADLIFWHPPYWKMVRYDLLNPNDFSNGPYAKYISRMWNATTFLRSLVNAENPNARMAIQLGDYRNAGRYYWIARDMADIGKLTRSGWMLDSVLIRKQHGVTSDSKTYSRRLIRIMHETVLVLAPL